LARPFTTVRGEPRDAYDAIVIGAGIGGLTCANLLACGGLRVLLVEQHYMVGGYCSTFRRAGYVFDASTHFYPLLGNPQTISGRILADTGVRTEWVKMDPVDHFHLPDGSTFSVPADFAAYIARLKARFPDERSAIDEFFCVVRAAYVAGLLYYFRGRDSHRFRIDSQLTVSDALNRYFRDPKLKLVLTADCPHWGSPPSRTSFVFDSMLRLSYFLGNYYPRGGSQVFADALARGLTDKGGDVLIGSRVTRVLVERGRACGVEVLVGPARAPRPKRIASDVVVSNADYLQTVEELVGREYFDGSYVRHVRSLRPTYSCHLTHLGVRGVDADTLRNAQGYYWDQWDADQVGTTALRFKIFVPTLYEPAMAPPGGHVVILQKVLAFDYDRIPNWPAHKRVIETTLLEALERVLPGVTGKVVVGSSASARTAYKYTLNHQGAMLGWEMSPQQLGVRRPGTGSSIANLHFVGHWVQPGGGITPVMISAARVAKRIVAARSGVGDACEVDLAAPAVAFGDATVPDAPAALVG